MRNIKIELVELSKLIPNPDNNRVISEIDREMLYNKLEYYGHLGCLVCDSNYNLISGHQRKRILEEQGVTQTLVAIGDYTKEEADELAKILNSDEYMGEWDFNKLREFKDLVIDMPETGLSILLSDLPEETVLDTSFDFTEEELKKRADKNEELDLERQNLKIKYDYLLVCNSEQVRPLLGIIKLAHESYPDVITNGSLLLRAINDNITDNRRNILIF